MGEFILSGNKSGLHIIQLILIIIVHHIYILVKTSLSISLFYSVWPWVVFLEFICLLSKINQKLIYFFVFGLIEIQFPTKISTCKNQENNSFSPAKYFIFLLLKSCGHPVGEISLSIKILLPNSHFDLDWRERNPSPQNY